MSRLTALLLTLFAVLATSGRGASALRSLPEAFTPGIPFTVAIAVTPGTNTAVQAIEDRPPAGWTVSSVSHGGIVDPVLGSVKWGPFLDAVARNLTYTLVPAAAPSGTFSGTAVFDSASLATAGISSIARFPGQVVRSLPADFLPGTAFEVTVRVEPAVDVEVWAVEESAPEGWTVSGISDGGITDPLSSSPRIKWGPFLDANARTLRYTLQPPASVRGDVSLEADVRLGEFTLHRTAGLPIRASTLVRGGSTNYLPTQPLQFELALTPAAYVAIQAVEERIGLDWTPTTISHGGTWDAAARTLRWGPFLDATPRTLSYGLLPPAGSSATLQLAASARFDGTAVSNAAAIPRRLEIPVSEVIRTLPTFYVPGTPLTVSLSARPIDTARVYAVEERVPAGWQVASISAGGSWDPLTSQAKWGPFFDEVATPRALTYTATPPADTYGLVVFDGSAQFDGLPITTTGAVEIRNSPPRATRIAPPRYMPGVPFQLRLELRPVPGVELQAVVESVPPGWTATAMTDGGLRDPISGELKWGPFIDRSLRTLTWTLIPPTNAAGPADLTGSGFFNRDSLVVTGAVRLLRNQPPVAVSDSDRYRAGEAFKIALLRLLANDSDADGDLLRFGGVTPLSDEGGAVRIAGAFLFYTPPTGFTGTDRVRYTVVDPHGGSSDAVLELSPAGSDNGQTLALVGLSAVPGGGLRARFAGIPGFPYRILAASSLTPPVDWSQVGCATAASDGRFEWVDVPPPGTVSRYYRLEASSTPCL
jgi:hypothetical protein